MKLEIARGIFLVGALGVTALAAAAWQEPEPVVIGADTTPTHCPLPAAAYKQKLARTQPDSDNLLLLVFGLSHAMKGTQ